MTGDLPSSTPEKGGDDKAAANASRNEHDGKPSKKFNPADMRGKRKKSRLTQLEWGGFFGDIFVILWVWSDLIACRDFNRLIFLLAALVVAHGVLCLFLSKLFSSWRWTLVVWVLLCIPAAWIAFKNSRPLIIEVGEIANIIIPEWQPPEMSADCENIVIYFGGQEFIFKRPIDRSRISPEEIRALGKIAGHPVFPSANIVGYFSTPTNTIIYSGNENGDAKFNIPMNVNEQSVDCPVSPFVKNNRLFVVFGIPSNDENKAISLTDNLDSQIPPNWDRNYSSNAFEIVREDKLPVFQVIYRRPNEIQVNGIFIVSSNCILSAFEGHIDISYFCNADGSLPDIPPWNVAYANILPMTITNLEMAYAMTYSNQDAIFKYPAWRYLGDFVKQ
jgi:hypothetical protein